MRNGLWVVTILAAGCIAESANSDPEGAGGGGSAAINAGGGEIGDAAPSGGGPGGTPGTGAAGGGGGAEATPDGSTTGGASAPDAGPQTADQSVNPADAALPPPSDSDDDGVPDAVDNCPGSANALQRDADADGLGDACDVGDLDGDGLADRDDPCPAFAGPSPDTDGDGLGDGCDVCREVSDPDQRDSDADGIGDACEIPNDDDSDGVPDARDNCPIQSNGDQADADQDGVGTACDDCPRDADPEQLDLDTDGLGDACDVCPDAPLVAQNHVDQDGDGQPTCAGDCDDANPARKAGGVELCDGIDNDCNQDIDEPFPELGVPCSAGLGACTVAGEIACQRDGTTGCDARALAPRAEVCDQVDNDCDGNVDDALANCCVPGEVEDCGTDEGACRAGRRTCEVTGSWGPCDGQGPAPEDCNGVDEDCDGATDEALGVRDCGVGQCARRIAACVDGEGPMCVPGVGATPEVCDGVDNDCDGAVDDGFDFAGDERNCGRCGRVCDPGIECLQGSCGGIRPVVLSCGRTGLPVTDFIRGELAVQEVRVVDGCLPDADTQAVVVARPGLDVAVANAAAIRAWMNEGGQVLTEYNISDDLYNALFDGQVPQGPHVGACHDNVQTQVQFSPDDPFWAVNEFLPVAAGAAGCGRAIQDRLIPDFVPLGGWDAINVSLGYVDAGAGRFWFVEADWSDGQDPVTDASRDLMASMILGGR